MVKEVLPSFIVEMADGSTKSVPLAVRTIFISENGMSRVSLNTDAFNITRSRRGNSKEERLPLMKYSRGASEDGQGFRAFAFGKYEVFTHWVPSEVEGEFGASAILMKETDAKELHRPTDKTQSVRKGLLFGARLLRRNDNKVPAQSAADLDDAE